jgi:hypothetical protein
MKSNVERANDYLAQQLVEARHERVHYRVVNAKIRNYAAGAKSQVTDGKLNAFASSIIRMVDDSKYRGA